MRKNRREDSQVDNSWLLPYADMLTLLLALFVILFAMSEVDAKKYDQLMHFFKGEFSSQKIVLNHNLRSTEIRSMDAYTFYDHQLKETQDAIEQYISDHELTDMLQTSFSDDGLLITISNEVSFDSGSARVKNSGRKIAEEISEFLELDPPHKIIISGHTDDVPMHNEKFKSNWELSVMRAVNFMYLILENEKLHPEKFSARGYGEYQPIVKNTNDENREKNRRVEILILPEIEK